MDSIDYYDRYAVPYYEETVEFGMEEQIKRFVELLPESADVLEAVDRAEIQYALKKKAVSLLPWMVLRKCVSWQVFTQEKKCCILERRIWNLKMFFMGFGPVLF